MTKRIFQITVCGVLVGLAVGVAGCKSVCPANKRAGLATIVCQPMDLEVTDSDQPAKFKVVATGSELTYRWYWYDQPLGERNEKAGQFRGVFTDELTVLGTNRYEAAPYRCEIGSQNSCGDDKRTSTRTAYLSYQPTLHIMMMSTPTANLPPPGAPRNYSNFTYCSVSSPFRNIKPPLTNPTPSKCYVTLKMIEPPNSTLPPVTVNTGFYLLKVVDGATHPVLVQDAGDGLRKWFLPTKTPYVMTVYFNCQNCPTDRPKIYLDLEWEP